MLNYNKKQKRLFPKKFHKDIKKYNQKGISVFVMVEMDNQHSRFQELFERKMRQETDVVSCYEISGDYDFMLLIHAESMESYHSFTRRVLTGEYHVRTYKSLFVMNFTKAESGILL